MLPRAGVHQTSRGQREHGPRGLTLSTIPLTVGHARAASLPHADSFTMPTTRLSDRLNPPPPVPSKQSRKYVARLKKQEYARKRRANLRAEVAARAATVSAAQSQLALKATKAAAASTLPRAPKAKTTVQRAASSPRAAPPAPLRRSLVTPPTVAVAALARCLSALGCAGVKTEADLVIALRREEAECIRVVGEIDARVAELVGADVAQRADLSVERANVSRAWTARKLLFDSALRDLQKMQSATPASDDDSETSGEPDECEGDASESCDELSSSDADDDGWSAVSRRRHVGPSARASRPEPAIEADPRSLEQLLRDGDRGDTDALIHLATFYRRKLKPDMAMQICNRAIELNRARARSSLDAVFLLAQILFVDTGDFLGARPLLELCARKGNVDAQQDLVNFAMQFYPAA